MDQVTRHRVAGALVAVAVAALALAACGSSPKSSGAGTDSATAPGADTTIVIGSDGSSTVVEIPSGTTPSGITPPRVDAGGGSAAVDSNGPPGSFAPGILSPSASTEVLVEVRTQSAAGPQQASIDHLTSVLRSVTGKPVNVASGPGISGGATSWSADELRSVADAGTAQGNGRAVIHLLFVHGSFSGDNSVLGIAVRGDAAAIFVDQVNASSTPLVGSGGIEAAVVTHEVGHLMGLVDLYLHTGRQDPDHPGHSTNPKSVMYWAVESNLVADLLQGGPPKDFDGADLADLQTIRNG
jgi:hypothetical protein